jgi:hypothetical protein
MIYELRTYAVKPGLLNEYLAFFRDVGMPVRAPHNNLIGFWYTEIGPLNQVFHIWQYESLDHRAKLRAELMQTPQWAKEFLPKAMAMLDRMDSVIINPASFSPLQ